MKKEKWTKKKYQNFLKELKKEADLKYKAFHSGLGINNDYLIGIPIPKCRMFAKEISKTDYISFIKLNTHKTYEERLIHGLLIGYIKEDIDTILKLFSDYITYIDNWALCDSPISNLHIIKNNLDYCFPFVLECLQNDNEWHKRVGYVILLTYYINDDYLNKIYELCDANQKDSYYVKMAIAWLISICYIKYPDETLNYLKHNQLDNWTHNKAIQKIRESNRVPKSDKEKILKYKRNN